MKIKKILALSAAFAVISASTAGAVLLEEVTPAPFSENGITLNASLVEFADVIDSDVFDIGGAVWRDGRLYVLHQGGNIDCFVLEGNFLVRDPKAFEGKGTVSLGRKLSSLSMDEKGWLYASSTSETNLYIIEPNGTVHTARENSSRGAVSVHPSGEWGLRYTGSTNAPLTRTDLKRAAAGEKAFNEVLKNPSFAKGAESTSFSSLAYLKLNADGSYFVSGLSHKLKGQGFWGLIDKNGKEIFAFLEKYDGKDPKRIRNIGSVQSIIPCKYGYALLDGNMRRLHIYDKKGAFITNVDLKQLLGLKYCWPSTMNRIDDNTVLITCTQNFPYNSKNVESLVMKVTGL